MILPAVAGVIGWPVAHSKSPIIHRFWLEKLGIDGDYSRFPVAPDRLADFVRAMPAMGLRGVNVTVPHKVAVLDLLDDIDPAVRDVGAVNTLWVADGQIAGTNTDIDGIIGPCRDSGIAGGTVVILGSGGAARAALAAAKALGAADAHIVARNPEAGERLLRDIGMPGRVYPFAAPMPPCPEARLLFNATSLGMVGMPALPFDLAPFPKDCTVFDAVYAPLATPLLLAAQARGMPCIDGLAMLVGQAAKAFETFFGQAAPRVHDADLRRRLAPGA